MKLHILSRLLFSEIFYTFFQITPAEFKFKCMYIVCQRIYFGCTTLRYEQYEIFHPLSEDAKSNRMTFFLGGRESFGIKLESYTGKSFHGVSKQLMQCCIGLCKYFLLSYMSIMPSSVIPTVV